MTENLFTILVLIWIGVAMVTFPFLLKIRTPYGRHTAKGWGPMMDNKLGWFVMEFPTLALFVYFFLTGPLEKDIYKWILFSVFALHYVNRIFIFPFRTKTKNKKMPVIIALSAVFFNLVNGSINGYWLGWYAEPYGNYALLHFIPGMLVFITGFIINQDSDNRLINLRKPGDKGYYIPRGGLFKWLSCPNFLVRSLSGPDLPLWPGHFPLSHLWFGLWPT
jgi:hypothetical protein